MRIIVDFPARASGRPKGHSSRKVIVGYLSEEFDLEVNDEPMVKTIELKSPYSTVEYLQNGDGHSYHKIDIGSSEIIDGHHFLAKYNSEGNPFIDTLMKALRREFDKKPESEVYKDYYPKQLHGRSRYAHDRLLDIANSAIENLEINQPEIARLKTRDVVGQHVLSQGNLYKRVPEPCYGVSLNDQQVSIKQCVYRSNEELESSLLNDRHTLAFFNLSNIDRVRDFARELAAEIGGEFNGQESVSHTVEHYAPISSYADELTLYRLGRQIEHCVADHMARGTSTMILDKLLAWDSQTLGLLRELTLTLNKRQWIAETPALERIVGSCLEHDRENRSQMFTKAPKGLCAIDFGLTYSQWQMREFSSPSMRR